MRQAMQGDPTAVPFGCVYFAFLVACACISARAGTTRSLGEPQDLPEHRMGPVDAILRGMRKSFQDQAVRHGPVLVNIVFGVGALFGLRKSAARCQCLDGSNGCLQSITRICC